MKDDPQVFKIEVMHHTEHRSDSVGYFDIEGAGAVSLYCNDVFLCRVDVAKVKQAI